MSKGPGGISGPNSLYTYNIRILSIKMKVKFQCKMKIQFESDPITNEVTATDGNSYVFNQDCALVQRDTTQNYFTLSVTLITNKGAKYIAGLAHLYHSELARAADTGPSSRIVINLSKCLDPEAILQIVVRDAFKNGIKQNPIRQQSKYKKSKVLMGSNLQYSQIQSRKIQNSPPLSPRGQSFHALGPSTRSQIYLPRGINSKATQSVLNKVDSIKKRRSRSRLNGSHYRQKTIEALSNPHNSFGISFTERQMPTYDRINERSPQRTSAYKQSYVRLKQKLRKQQQQSQKQYERRLSIQSNEAVTKIEALKYRLRCEQLQQNMIDKNGNIKKLEIRIQQLQRLLRGQTIQPLILSKSMHVNSAAALYTNANATVKSPSIVPPIKIYTESNENAISTLEAKVSLANQQLEQLRSRLSKINKTHAEKQNSLIRQLQTKNTKILQLEEQIKSNGSKYSGKNEEFLKISLQKQNKIVSQLQRQHQQSLRKLSEADRVHKMLERNIQDFKIKIQDLNKNLHLVGAQKLKLVDQIQAQKNKANLAEFSSSVLKKNLQKLENELSQVQKFKQKYHDSLVEIKKIEGQRKLQQKNYQSLMKTNQTNTHSIQQKYQQQIDSLNKRNQQLESKNMQQNIKIKELQTYMNTTARNQLQNYKRLTDRLQKQCDEYKSNERMSKKQYIAYESRMGQSNSELEVWKNKFKSLENVYKLESDKFMNQIGRMKLSLQQEMMNQLSLKEKNQSLAAELSLASGKLGMLDEKYSKDIKDLNNKIQLQINKNNKLQQTLKKQEQINSEIKDKQKHLRSKIQEYGQNQTQFSDLIKRYEQQMVRLKGALGISEQKLTSKTEQNEQLIKQVKQLNEKYNNTFHKNQQLTFEIKNSVGELEKQVKQINKLQYELSNLRANMEGKDKIIEKQKNTIEQELKQKNQTKQELSKIQINMENIVKQYDRFRDHIYEILVREFTGVDGLQSMASFMIKNRQNNMTLKQSLSKNGIQIGGYHHSSRTDLRNSQNLYIYHNQQDIKLSKSIKTFGYPQSTNSQYPMIHSPSSLALNNNDIVNTINQFSKQSKALLSKMIEEYRFLQKEYQYCKDTFSDKQAKFNQESAKAEFTIHKLEDQLSKVYHEKEISQKRFDTTVKQLTKENELLKAQLEKKNLQLDESVFTYNGIKMEKQTEKQFYQTKVLQNSTTIHKLNNALESLSHKFERLEQDSNRYKFENEALFSDNRKLKQDLQIRQKKIRQLQYQINICQKLYEESNSKCKQLLVSISEMELQLSNQKEKNGKNLQIISQQQKKLSQTKQFINNLIKQKQAVVKQDIANGHRIIELQSINMNISTELEHIKSKLESKLSQLSGQKQNIKKLNINLKELQNQRNILKQSNMKLGEQLKQKEKEIALLNDNIKSKDSQYSKQLQNRNRQLQQLSQNKQLMGKLSNQETINLKKQISRLQEEVVVALQQEIRLLNNVLQSTQRELQSTSRNLEEKTFQINSYKEVQDRINGMRQKQEQDIGSLMDQIREKDEQMFNLSGQLYALEQKYNQMITACRLEKQKIEQQFDYKYDSVCEDYQTKLDQIEKQRDYLKQKLTSTEEQLRKNSERLRNLEYQQGKQRILSKDRLVKVQQEKAVTVNTLKADLKRITEQKDRLTGQLKRKQIETQKLKSEEKADKNMIQKLQIKIKETELKLEQCHAQIFSHAQSQKKKQIYIKQYQQSVSNYQWVLQREIKKQLQNVTKFIVSANTQTSEGKKKVAQMIKQVQNRMSRQVGERITISMSM